jgi:hypothetical protein
MKILSKITTKTSLGDLTWQGFDVRSLPTSNSFYKNISKITNDGFGIKMNFEKQAIRQTVEASTHAYLLYHETNQSRRIVGFTFLKVLPGEDGSIVELSKVCLAKRAQKRGQSSILKNAIIFDFDVSILTAKSQNTSVMHLIRKGDQVCFPFDKSYDTNQGQQVLDILSRNTLFTNADSQVFDMQSGVIQARYGGRLGDHQVAGDSKYSAGLNRDRGDAYLITSLFKTSL